MSLPRHEAHEMGVRMRVRLVTYAWGVEHLDRLIHYAISAALAPGNLPALAERYECSAVIVTEQKLFSRVRAHPTIRTLRQVCPVHLVALDDLISQPWQYGMTLTHALFRGFEDLGRDVTDTYLLFLNSDFLLAENSYTSLISRIQSGERTHFSPSYATIEDRATPALNKQRRPDGSLCIPHRELADLIITHRHNTVRAKTINQPVFEFEYTDQFYWQVDPTTIIARQMPISLVGMRPERYVPNVNTFWDWGLIYEFCPSRKFNIIGDSDEFLMMELRHDDQSVESMRLGKTSPREVARRTKGYITQYQIDHARHQLLLHSKDAPRELVVEAEGKLRAYIDDVLSRIPSAPLDHRGHTQWTYHKKHFRERLEHAWRARSGISTGPKVEPSRLLRLDRSLRDLTNPLGSRRHPIWKIVRDGAIDHTYYLLIVCEEDSSLLRNVHLMPGSHLHLTPAALRGGALKDLAESPRFDLCMIEISYAAPERLWGLFEAVLDRVARGGRAVFVWHAESSVPVICAREIATRLVVGSVDFDVWCTRSRTSSFAARLRARWTAGLRRQAGLALTFFIGISNVGRDFAALRLGMHGRYFDRSIPREANSIAVNIRDPSTVQARYLRTNREEPPDFRPIDLAFNPRPEFTKWLVREGALREPFIVVDVGVFGGENPRWHFFGDYLEVHGFDAVKEAIDDLRRHDDKLHKRFYRWLAIGNEDGERQFFFDPLNPTNSSFFPSENVNLRRRNVRIRSLDSLFLEGSLPRADFLKVDVEGFEGDVFAGADHFLSAGVLGVECESNFDSSSTYPRTHFAAVHDAVMKHGLRLVDLSFDRQTRLAYERARRQRDIRRQRRRVAGRPSTFNILFCRDVTPQVDGIFTKPAALTVDQLLKLIAVYELHGLQDIGTEIALQFADALGPRIDVERAVDLLCQ